MREHPKARHDQLLAEDVNDELVVYDLDRGTVHLLNPVAAFVWKRCDGRTTVAELATLLQAELDLLESEDVVLLALHELEDAQLLEEGGAASTATRAFSRRQMLARLGVAAGIGLTLPLIESMNPPPAYAAVSVFNPCSGQSCGRFFGRCEGEPECPDSCTCVRVRQTSQCECR
jgi:hypothetical protein